VKNPLFHSFALLLALTLVACNNNEAGTKDISKEEENLELSLVNTIRLDLELTLSNSLKTLKKGSCLPLTIEEAYMKTSI
jgi:hypothetical protein